jgi:hypothetical protein
MSCATWLVVVSPPWKTEMITRAACARAPTRAVSRGSAKEAVRVGAMTSSGPR